MSWGVNASGRASAVQEKLTKDFGNVILSEPEETVKNHVREAIYAALGSFPKNFLVYVEASGYQYNVGSTEEESGVCNEVRLIIKPLVNFLR